MGKSSVSQSYGGFISYNYGYFPIIRQAGTALPNVEPKKVLNTQIKLSSVQYLVIQGK
jgi:hypothetical protein